MMRKSATAGLAFPCFLVLGVCIALFGCSSPHKPEKTGFDVVYVGEVLERRAQAVVTNAANSADQIHDALFVKVQEVVVFCDSRFIAKDEEPHPVPASRFRIGLYADAAREEEMEYGFNPEFEIELKVPNIERALSLFITTEELGELPGTDVTQRERALRLGLRRITAAGFDADAGVKWDWPPNPFVQLKWHRDWEVLGLQMYPGIKGFYELDEGFGSSGSFTVDKWFGRGLFRNAAGVKWEEGTNGVAWSHTVLIGYARELIDESKLGGRAAARDLAQGGSLRYRIKGHTDTGRIDEHEADLMFKFPMRRKWAYCVIAPGMRFRNEREWELEPRITLGIDMLFWDVGDR